MKRLQFNLLFQETTLKFALDLWELIITLKMCDTMAATGYLQLYQLRA